MGSNIMEQVKKLRNGDNTTDKHIESIGVRDCVGKIEITKRKNKGSPVNETYLIELNGGFTIKRRLWISLTIKKALINLFVYVIKLYNKCHIFINYYNYINNSIYQKFINKNIKYIFNYILIF